MVSPYFLSSHFFIAAPRLVNSALKRGVSTSTVSSLNAVCFLAGFSAMPETFVSVTDFPKISVAGSASFFSTFSGGAFGAYLSVIIEYPRNTASESTRASIILYRYSSPFKSNLRVRKFFRHRIVSAGIERVASKKPSSAIRNPLAAPKTRPLPRVIRATRIKPASRRKKRRNQRFITPENEG